MVDPAAAVVRHLEARRLPRADYIYADALEPSVPARHVYAGKPTALARDRFSAAALDLAHDGVGGARSVAGDSDRPRAGVMAQLSRVRVRYALNKPNLVCGSGVIDPEWLFNATCAPISAAPAAAGRVASTLRCARWQNCRSSSEKRRDARLNQPSS